MRVRSRGRRGWEKEPRRTIQPSHNPVVGKGKEKSASCQRTDTANDRLISDRKTLWLDKGMQRTMHYVDGYNVGNKFVRLKFVGPKFGPETIEQNASLSKVEQ